MVLERAGKLKGVLAFEFARSAEREAASISGSFEGHSLRVRLYRARRTRAQNAATARN